MKRIFFSIILILSTQFVFAQDIIYADVIKNDVQRMNFEILGKVANNYLVYKELKGQNRISVYDEGMRLIQEVPIKNLPPRNQVLDMAFFTGSRNAHMTYQYQSGNIVYLMAATIEANGQILNEPIALDTTMIDYKTESKIYNSVKSDDGSKIILFKINRKNRQLYQFYAKLYNSEMNLLNEDEFTIPMDDESYKLADYSLTNSGKLVFVKYSRLKSGNIAAAEIIERDAQSSTYNVHGLGSAIGLNNLFLDDIKLKIDEQQQRYLLASLYSNSKKGNIDGMYVAAFGKKDGNRLFEKTTIFDDDFRQRAKNGTGLKTVFNDFFINNVVLQDDGSFTIATEAFYTSGNNSWDRWGYWGSPYFYGGWGFGWGGWGSPGWGWGGYWSPYRFYSPFYYSSYWWGGWGPGWGYGYDRSTFHADNIAVISFDKNGNKQWDNVIVKRQSDTETDGSISYQVLHQNQNIHFLLNNAGKIASLEDITISENGTMHENPPINAKEKRLDFMPRYGRQVGTYEMIIPYRLKNNISFAKVRY